MKKLFLKYKSQILYIFFGGCTTLINIVSFWLLSRLMPDMTIVTNAIAWVVSVAFAFVTNRIFVFESHSRNVLREAGSFLLSRLATFALDELIMYVSVELLFQNELMWKLISNVLVIILNYVFSKLFVFNKK